MRSYSKGLSAKVGRHDLKSSRIIAFDSDGMLSDGLSDLLLGYDFPGAI